MQEICPSGLRRGEAAASLPLLYSTLLLFIFFGSGRRPGWVSSVFNPWLHFLTWIYVVIGHVDSPANIMWYRSYASAPTKFFARHVNLNCLFYGFAPIVVKSVFDP